MEKNKFEFIGEAHRVSSKQPEYERGILERLSYNLFALISVVPEDDCNLRFFKVNSLMTTIESGKTIPFPENVRWPYILDGKIVCVQFEERCCKSQIECLIILNDQDGSSTKLPNSALRFSYRPNVDKYNIAPSFKRLEFVFLRVG